MDIVRTPSTPDGNPHLADAPPEPREPPLIRREDYQPFAWLVPTTHLAFDLASEETTVTATLQVERNPAATPSPILRLSGDGLEPLGVEVDGEPVNSWAMEGSDLIVTLPAERHQVRVVTRLNPAENSQLMGLYASGGMLCTQCEAEGFRRITFFPDRPDVLSTYTVRLNGNKDAFPVLLSNGNKVAEGELADGRHFAEWHDPWPKPSYLFALVAGNLVARRDRFVTRSGRQVELAIWVRDEDSPRTQHAMESLKQAMRWDEDVFGREYDLDVFNIVAVGDFNMGAMENKGLNIFNTKYVLADVDTATDGDFDAVQGVIAHEYFHNWSGNRVTCRDWFQLSLKEGFTVLRDQLFSEDMHSAAVKRIEDVRVLRSIQFPEDSGPLAHPIRPDSFREISNFYTATIYNKGAEIIRMMRTLAGTARFRQATDLYFARHDGEAATCEDFIRAVEAGAGLDLSQFRLWYGQAGTPVVTATTRQEAGELVLALGQVTPPTPGQPDKQPVPIPLKVAVHDRADRQLGEERLIVLAQAEQEVRLPFTGSTPAVSINRGFTAPVSLRRDICLDELLFLATCDDDPFSRSEALQDLAVRHLVHRQDEGGRDALGEAFRATLADESIDDLLRGELLMLPGMSYLMEQVERGDPGELHARREGLKAWLGDRLGDEMRDHYARTAAVPFALSAAAKGARKVKSAILSYLAAADPVAAARIAAKQSATADNMTDRQGALLVLAGLDVPQRAEQLAAFYERYKSNPLVIDKWFAIQAMSAHPLVIDQVRELERHPDFTLRNPNRVRSLFMAFTGTPQGFHAPSGEGYRMIADLILRLDPINPQTAARFVAPLGRWRRLEDGRAGLMREQLQRVADAPRLSRDTYEQVSRSLG